MPKTITFSFQQRFEARVSLGLKLHTVRSERDDNAQPGDFVHCYVKQRTKDCRLIYASILESSHPIRITAQGISTLENGREWIRLANPTAFAQSDGFDGPSAFADMKTFLGVTPGNPFTGRLYRWHNAAALIQEASAEAMLGIELLTAAPEDRAAAYSNAVEMEFGHFDAPMLSAAASHIGSVWAALEWLKRRKENPRAAAKAKKHPHADYCQRPAEPIAKQKAKA